MWKQSNLCSLRTQAQATVMRTWWLVKTLYLPLPRLVYYLFLFLFVCCFFFIYMSCLLCSVVSVAAIHDLLCFFCRTWPSTATSPRALLLTNKCQVLVLGISATQLWNNRVRWSLCRFVPLNFEIKEFDGVCVGFPSSHHSCLWCLKQPLSNNPYNHTHPKWS